TGLSRHDRDRLDRAGCTGWHSGWDHRTDCPGVAHGGHRTGLPADVDRRGYRTHARLKPGKIPAVAGSRRCALDAGCQSARAEDGLSTARDRNWEDEMKLPRRQFLHLAAGAAALPVISRTARAQAYPARPVR